MKIRPLNLRMSLAQRLVLFTQAVFVLLTLSIGAVIGYTVFVETKQQLLDEQHKLNTQLATRIDRDLADRRDTLEPLASQLTDGQQLKSLVDMQHALDTRIKLHEFFNAGLVVMDLEGNLIVDSPVIPGRVGLNISDRKHVKQAIQTQQPVITPPFIGRAVQEPVFHIYTPIFADDKTLLGFVIGVNKLAQDNFLLGLSELVLGGNREFCVLDLNTNLIVTGSNRELVLTNLPDAADSEKLLKIRQGDTQGTIRNDKGSRELFVATSLQNIDWVVVHSVSENEIFQPVWALLWKLAALVLLLLLLVVFTASWFIRRELKPLEESAEKIDQMVSGVVQAHKLDVVREDELGRLLSAFNRLLDKQQRNMVDLEAAKQASDQANEAKSQFLANMSHEIRTPLNAVIGLTEMLMNDVSTLSNKALRRVQQVHASGKLLLGIINDVLDYSKIESSRLEIEAVKFKLNDILDQLSVLFSDITAKKDIELVFHVRPDVPTSLIGDSLRLTQVLTNLMSNAVKFTEQGEIELCIRLQSLKANQATLSFSVRDTGMGMNQMQRERLFHAFMQADTSITRKHGGTGLGLVISQRLLHLMDGTDIQVHSESEKGSVFSFELTMPVAGEAQKDAHHFECDPTPCRALVVDDQSISRVILREILEAWDFEVDEAENGEQALAKVAEHLEDDRFYKVILMDWEMPKLNGLLALRKIKSLYLDSGHQAELPALLMVSAHSLGEINMDQDDEFPFLHKPFSPSSLYNAINDLHRLEQLGVATQDQAISFKNQSILVVEDNDINQEVIGEMLENLNLQVDFANDGQQGVNALKQKNYSLVLMDIQMPVMDGYQAAQAIREFNTTLPIVALTAAAMVEDKQKAMAAGMDAHLAKPISLIELKQVLMSYLAWDSVKVERPFKQVTNQVSVQALQPPGLVDSLDQADKGLNHSQPTLLIVDDEPSNAKILANGLKDDYKIQLANSGAAALKLAIKKSQPDLVLLDIMMEDMDGYEVCKALKNNPDTQHIPIIFVSALDDNSDEEKGLNLGAVDYISKPFHLPIVKSRVRNHLALKLKTDLLERMSHVDGLTHIANRRQFDEMFVKETHRLARSGQPLGLIMLDIDFFKPFNDHYGHGQGDLCLQKVAQALQNVIKRPGDLVARYGGEEFVVLLPETDKVGVAKIAESLLKAVSNLKLKHEFSETADHITVSVGGVVGQVDTQQQSEELLKQADDALYHVKQNGRNHVFVMDAKT